MSNIYSSPEAYGLTVLGEVEWTEPCWSFDTTIVWRNENNELFWASDAGCSCPSPFEDFDLASLERGSFFDLSAALHERLKEERSNGFRREHDRQQADVVDLLAAVRKAVPA